MRKGSALLIVLGMLAFMIVSAVAFSAYMRFSRLPSSYLRRTAASRQMVKAALARAIDQIDAAVGNNPHPGVGTLHTAYPRATGEQKMRNIWLHRVFFGDDSSVEESDTVPTLTLEGLAYIPPPLVNEARYYSRLSPAGVWKSLDFDVGRYAFCALDVSDYFDINRLTANYPRSSAANRRVSLAYLFENDRHTSAGSAAATWDDSFMKKFRTVDDDSGAISWSGSVAPLVSLADYNLALGKQGSVGDFRSPFYDYLTRSGGAGFYNTSSDRDEDIIRRQTFVTDGLFPEATTADGSDEDEPVNLAEFQPFEASLFKKNKPNLADVIFASSTTDEFNWREALSYVGCAALYDYLDPDHIPLSLAMPTVERVPMICGIQPVFKDLKFGVRRDYANEGSGGATADGLTVISGGIGDGSRVVEKTIHYRMALSFAPNNLLRVATVYPFNHKADDDGTFKLDGRVVFFLSSADMSLRTGANDTLHLEDSQIPSTVVDANKGVIGIKLSPQNLSFSQVEQEEDAVKVASVSLGSPAAIGSALSLDGNELLRVKYRWTQTVGGGGSVGGVGANQWTPTVADAIADVGNIVEAHCGIPALTANGTKDGDLSSDAAVLSLVKGSGTKKLQLNMAVQLRVLDKDDNVVDMVPACLADDRTQNGVNNTSDPKLSTIKVGNPYPLMRFDTAGGAEQNASMDYSLTALNEAVENNAGGAEVTLYPQTALVADPRYNYAPEYWFAHAGDLDKNVWLDNNHAADGDGDIFMATSDAGYLQSKYELAMLPRVARLTNYGNSLQTGNVDQPSTSLRSIPGSYGANQNVNWRTYEPFGDDEAAFENLPLVSGTTGYRINPYSDSTNVILAAFANTPIDWKRASTNDVAKIGGSGNAPYFPEMDAAEFNKDYAWNQYSSGRFGATKMAWGDLQALAGRFIKNVRSKNGDWLEAWNDLGWNDAENKFGDIDLSASDDLYAVDRKFLYGFWRECFAARQQLFLVFVRAEPVMMGGGGMGQIPPQLGARAVALVWRSPDKAQDDKWPHQTRVLFYRQLD